MLESVIEFLKFYPSAISRYRVHSPFVSALIDQVINGSNIPSNQVDLEKIRRDFLKDDRKISDLALGAPSHFFRSGTRLIRQIARTSLMPRWQAEILFRLVDHFKPKNMLELGTCLGISTLYQAAGNPQARFYTIEGHPELFAEASTSLRLFPYKRVKPVYGEFGDVLPSLLYDLKRLDYVFIDGDHTGAKLRIYMQMLQPYIHNLTVIVLHDIHWSSDMAETWNDLRVRNGVTVSIDLFHLGILFFRKEIREPIHVNLISHRYKPWQNGFFH